MATVAFGLAGVGAGNLVGGVIPSIFLGSLGTGLGALVDKDLGIFQPRTEVPRVADENFQGVADGSPANIVLGRTHRVTGTIIWLGKQSTRFRSSGVVEITQDMAVEFATNEISRYIDITANGHPIFAENQESIAIDFEIIAATTLRMDIALLPNGQNLFKPTGTFFINNSTGNDGSFVIEKVSLFSNGAIQVKVDSNTPFTVVGPDNGDIKFPPDITFAVGAFNLYTGTLTQTVDPVINAAESDVPAFRSRAYVVFQNVRKDLLGGGVPLFRALIEEKVDKDLDEVITDLMNLASYDPALYDVTDLVGIPFLGIDIKGIRNLRTLLVQIILAYDLDVFETNKLIFLRRS
jgi:hypothetical protein